MLDQKLPVARCLSIVGLLAGSLAITGCGPTGPVAAPTGYTRFDAPDKQYMCEAPTGWEIASTGSKGVLSNASFTQGSAKINIAADLFGSLMAGPGRPPDPNVEPPVVQIHELGKEKLTNSIPSAKEQAAEPIQTIIGEGRISEFSASGSLGSKIRGYRATVLSRDRRLTVICQCAESDWDKLKDPFKKVVSSLAPGSK